MVMDCRYMRLLILGSAFPLPILQQCLIQRLASCSPSGRRGTRTSAVALWLAFTSINTDAEINTLWHVEGACSSILILKFPMYCCHQLVWVVLTKTADSSIWNLSCQCWPSGTFDSQLNYFLSNSVGILIVHTEEDGGDMKGVRYRFILYYSESNSLVHFCRTPFGYQVAKQTGVDLFHDWSLRSFLHLEHWYSKL